MNKQTRLAPLIRYYMGRHKVKVIQRGKSKQIIEHLEKGYVGNKDCGYKQVEKGEQDITPIRVCFRRRRE